MIHININFHGTELAHTGCRHKTDCPYGIKNSMNNSGGGSIEILYTTINTKLS